MHDDIKVLQAIINLQDQLIADLEELRDSGQSDNKRVNNILYVHSVLAQEKATRDRYQEKLEAAQNDTSSPT